MPNTREPRASHKHAPITAPSLHLRAGELEDVADGLLEHHYDGHLDEEVREASAGVTLEGGGGQMPP